MKAISPVRSARNDMASPVEQVLGVSRSKSPLDDPLDLLYNMNHCYSMLKELVPSLPQNKSVSKMEILQHVIDYILDLQNALDSSSSFGGFQQRQTVASRSPMNISILTFQSSDLPKGTEAEDNGTLLR
ncbi:DNA-binding protein inhibitor ID-2b [Polymixia lowei]